ncbi:MAG TPA: signal peptidase II [Solirubrobacterales bacterium]|nr:signal peptidase II [Solirubrobacterales bacterium]
MSRTRAWIYATAVALAVIIADQVSKEMIENRLVLGERVEVLGPLELTHVGNAGIAFGLGSGGGALIVIGALAALAVIGILFARDPTRQGLWLAIGLLAGGAIGNLIDRIENKAVTDFIKLPLWPSFNIADIAITFGVLGLAWAIIRDGHREAGAGAGAVDGDAVADGKADRHGG